MEKNKESYTLYSLIWKKRMTECHAKKFGLVCDPGHVQRLKDEGKEQCGNKGRVWRESGSAPRIFSEPIPVQPTHG